MGDQTNITIASSKSKSLRSTIPKSIVSFMDLNAGDVLDWEMDIGARKERRVILRVVEREVRQ